MEYQKLLDSLVEFLTYILKLGLPILAVWLAWRWSEAKIKLSELTNKQETNWIVQEGAKLAIMGVEGFLTTATGLEKKEYAISWLEDWLLARNIKIDLNELELLVEAAVKNYLNNNDGKE